MRVIFPSLTVADIPVAAGGTAPAAAPLFAVVIQQQDGNGNADHRHGEQCDCKMLHTLPSPIQKRPDLLYEN